MIASEQPTEHGQGKRREFAGKEHCILARPAIRPQSRSGVEPFQFDAEIRCDLTLDIANADPHFPQSSIELGGTLVRHLAHISSTRPGVVS
jgi:hypothetical protein